MIAKGSAKSAKVSVQGQIAHGCVGKGWLLVLDSYRAVPTLSIRLTLCSEKWSCHARTKYTISKYTISMCGVGGGLRVALKESLNLLTTIFHPWVLL